MVILTMLIERFYLTIQRRNGLFVTAGGETLTPADVYHPSAVLAGFYSLSGRPDRAMIEQRICPPLSL